MQHLLLQWLRFPPCFLWHYQGAPDGKGGWSGSDQPVATVGALGRGKQTSPCQFYPASPRKGVKILTCPDWSTEHGDLMGGNIVPIKSYCYIHSIEFIQTPPSKIPMTCPIRKTLLQKQPDNFRPPWMNWMIYYQSWTATIKMSLENEVFLFPWWNGRSWPGFHW